MGVGFCGPQSTGVRTMDKGFHSVEAFRSNQVVCTSVCVSLGVCVHVCVCLDLNCSSVQIIGDVMSHQRCNAIPMLVAHVVTFKKAVFLYSFTMLCF